MISTQRAKARILVIDDEGELRELISTALGGQYEVLTAADGQEGVTLAVNQVPDLIVCDVILPKMTGSEVLRHLRTNPALYYIPVIMMTAAALDPVTVSMFQQHPNFRKWLPKPFKLDSLLESVAQVLSSRPTPPPRPVAPAAPASAPAKTSRAKYRILVVEDEVPFFEFLSLAMHPEDEVTRAPDGESGLEQIAKLRPNLVITDLTMPHMTGDRFLQAVAQDAKSVTIPVVLMTARPLSDEQKTAWFTRFPNLRYILQKPFDAATFRRIIDSILIRDLAS